MVCDGQMRKGRAIVACNFKTAFVDITALELKVKVKVHLRCTDAYCYIGKLLVIDNIELKMSLNSQGAEQLFDLIIML